MAVVQDTYSETHAVGAAGLIASTHTVDVDSYRVEGDDSIPFGRAVQQGTADDQVKAGVAAGAFAGITVLDKTLRPEQGDEYEEGDVASVLVRGDIWVEVDTAVAKGGNLAADVNTGRFNSKAYGSLADGEEEPADWAAATAYAVGDKVKNASKYWVATAAHTSATGNAAAGSPSQANATNWARYSGVVAVAGVFLSDGAADGIARARLFQAPA